MNNNKCQTKLYLIAPLLITCSFLSARLLLKACYGIELTVFSEEALFLICTSLWLVLVFLLIRQLVSGRFKQQVWYFPFVLILAKWPIDWGYNKLMSIEMEIVTNTMWLSLYHPVGWTCIIYLGLKFCIVQSKKDSTELWHIS